MTLHELSQLYFLNREIERDRKRLAELCAKAYAPTSPNVSGAPGSCGSDRVGRYAVEIADIESIIEAKLARCLDERCRLERYIAEIPDSLTRQIFTLRFINGLAWAQVAFSIGGNTTADGVKKSCYRYIKKNE